MTKTKKIIDSVLVSGAGDHSDPPTHIRSDGTKEWLDASGRPHRVDGPAIIRPSGHMVWCQHGKMHRDDGPAVEFANGTTCWYKHDKRHRLNGPAIYSSRGDYEWWANNRQFTEDEFYMYVDQETGEVLVPPGKKLTYDDL